MLFSYCAEYGIFVPVLKNSLSLIKDVTKNYNISKFSIVLLILVF